MTVFARRLKECREKKKNENPLWTQGYVAEKIGMARTTYTAYENGTKQPPIDTTNDIATLLGVSTDYLMGRTEIPYQVNKDEKDIAKRMEEIKKDLENSDGLNFSGEPMSEEAVESLLEAMEHVVRQTQRINKKYIPKKHRSDDNNE